MSFLEAIILGIIQGLTEFLPVSSSGHIEIGKAILDVQVSDPLLFSIVVHGATALSTIVVFRKTIGSLLAGLFKFKWNDETQYLFKIALSMIPVGVVGVLFEEQIEELFDGNVFFVGLMLLLTGVLLYFTTLAKEKHGKVTFKNAFVVGLVQAIAILPGISRSGSTIAASLLLGINKEKAAQFSFLMVLPPILGTVLLKVIKFMELSGTEASVDAVALEPISGMVLVVGFISAFVSGLFACQWMIKIVKRSKLQYFAFYCFAVGAIACIYTFIGA